MKIRLPILFCVCFFCCLLSFTGTAQNATVPQNILLQIVKAEDKLRFDQDLQELLRSANAIVRQRAALAAGRIGDEKAIPFLIELLEKDANKEVRAMSAFALGEIESINAGEALLKTLQKLGESTEIRARAIEAAGKIAAANAEKTSETATKLGQAILDALQTESTRQTPDPKIILLGLTAVLRAKPKAADVVIANFLFDKNARLKADALNALVRLRSKNENVVTQARTLLENDSEAIVRANAARLLGAAESANNIDLMVKAATNDEDERVRISAIRGLANLKDKKAAEPLLTRAERLFAAYKLAKAKFNNPAEKNELLEIAATLGKLLPISNDERAVRFLKEFRRLDEFQSPEVETALARVAPTVYLKTEPFSDFSSQNKQSFFKINDSWQIVSNIGQGLAEFANLPKEMKQERQQAAVYLRLISNFAQSPTRKPNFILAIPEILKAYAALKSDQSPVFPPGSGDETLSDVLRGYVNSGVQNPLNHRNSNTSNRQVSEYNDVTLRATAAELLGEQPASKENVQALQQAFDFAFKIDKDMNDAQLAILSALVKLDKKAAVSALTTALGSPDFLVRRHAATLIKQNDLTKHSPNIDEKVGTVKSYNPAYKTRLGQILNTRADYIRAISRRNGQTKAVVTTEKGEFTIDLLPEDAPLTVNNFIKLANGNYFNNTDFHRVVPNFVVQGGDPRGDGNGGPGWQIRDEINLVAYERGAIGMALSGKDTGGSQWFVTHSPQPHLDGGYTVFGRVDESGMKIVDKLARGDRILNIRIVENVLRPKSQNWLKK